MPSALPPAILRETAQRALEEDFAREDITSLVFTPESAKAKARIFVKEPGVLAGIEMAEEVFSQVDPTLAITAQAKDGSELLPGQTVLDLSGRLLSLLSAERAALNFLQHLSGIATQTRRYVEELRGTPCRVIDTRKTTPGLRLLQKYAVLCGGGTNHRAHLKEMFLVKDNHLALFGTTPSREFLQQAILRARTDYPEVAIEFEADTLKQVALFAELRVDRILLDNMSLEMMREAVALIAGRAQTEASGNMRLDRVRAVAETGVDFISVGSLTHSIRSLDFSMELLPDQ